MRLLEEEEEQERKEQAEIDAEDDYEEDYEAYALESPWGREKPTEAELKFGLQRFEGK